MRFVSRDDVSAVLSGRRVALVGSGPGVLDNAKGFIDSHDVVIRVNNYKLSPATGARTDVFFSFFGESIRKTARDLQRDGVKLCMCKCPDSRPIDSKWHVDRNKPRGVDFRYIYTGRAQWWFCDTYVPTEEEFLEHFNLLGGHVPTTGFSALLTLLSFEPTSVFMTGFDFFTSGLHNVNERWKAGDPRDPIGHVPKGEAQWLRDNIDRHPITVDKRLRELLNRKKREAA